MALTIYNTLTRKKELFKPIQAKQVGMYTCGPTVYNYTHLGNLRTFLFEDFLKRVLVYNDYPVKHVMNITDVGHLTSDADEGEDKMEKGARREKKSVWELAEFYTQAFQQDLRALNIIPPDIWCKATDHLKEQIALIKKIEANGYTYQTTDGIYLDTAKLPHYGRLANVQKAGLRGGQRVDLKAKKNITDFALWKFSPAGQKRQMEWPSPWGKGFPGWHLECSAMSLKYLGPQFDLHCGGEDLAPVHHNNEIAQAEAANGRQPVKYWMHGAFLLANKEKMAKSKGDFLTLEKIANPLAYRYLCLGTHYRKPLNFSAKALAGAQNALAKLVAAIYDYDDPTEVDSVYQEKFLALINDDLNLSGALALMWDLIKSDLESAKKSATIFEFDKVFGLNLRQSFDQAETNKAEVPEEILDLAGQRDLARSEKNWSAADDLRKKIAKLGYTVEDTPDGFKLHKT